MVRPPVVRWSLCLLFAVAGAAGAQTYPVKPVRLVTVAPGSANDLVARLIAQDLRTALGQSVIVDNRGPIATEIVAKSAADGYTLLLYGSAVWISPLMQRSERNYVADLSPITLVAGSPNVLVVHPSLPVKTARELIALAKRRPGQLHYAAGSLGAAPHLAAELFRSMAGVSIVRVPYKGTGPGMIGLLGGEVELMFPTAGSVTPHIKAGKVRALAVTSAQPTALAPGLPLLSETVPGYESVSLNGVFAPARTPAAIIGQLHQEIGRILGRVEARERLQAAGMDPVTNTPEQFAELIRTDIARWSRIVQEAGIAFD